MNNPKDIYSEGVQVIAPCTYTADTAADAINNLTQAAYEASGNAWDVYGNGKSKILNSTDSFMDDIAEAFAD